MLYVVNTISVSCGDKTPSQTSQTIPAPIWAHLHRPRMVEHEHHHHMGITSALSYLRGERIFECGQGHSSNVDRARLE